MSSPTLRPDESLRIYKKNERLVVLSVAEKNGIRVGKSEGYWSLAPISFPKGVYLFAEKVTVTSDVSATNGLTIATRHLARPGNGKRFELNASGTDGAEGIPAKPSGSSGGGGGTLGLYVQNLSDDGAKAVTLLARGGNGGDTHTSQGQVGDGGKGGKIVSVFQPTYSRVLQSVQEYLNGFSATGMDQLVTTRDALFLKAQTLMNNLDDKLAATTDTITQIFGELRSEVEKIKRSERSTTGDLHRAADVAHRTLSLLILQQKNLTTLKLDQVRGGYPGTGIDVDVGEGKIGEAGELSHHFITSPKADSLVNIPLPFVHPEQCAMLLERANTFFYIGSPRMRSHALMLYQRLIDCLAFVPPLTSSHMLYKQYGYYETEKIMPPNSLRCLADIRKSAYAQATRLLAGTDFYGHTERWVPRESYTQYENTLQTTLDDFEFFEDAYTKYHAALEKQEELTNAVRIASTNTSRKVNDLEYSSVRLWDELDSLDKKIKGMKSLVEDAQLQLRIAYEAEISRIRVAFSLSIPQIINAMKDVAMVPGKAMASVAATDLLYQGSTSIPMKDGRTVTKEYIISEFKTSEATIMDVSLELKSKLDGTYVLDGDSSKRLIVEKERMLDQLNEFSTEAFGGVIDADTRKDLKEKFDVYIQLVTERNEHILQYNLYVDLILKNSEEKTRYKDVQSRFEDTQITQYNPHLHEITDYITAIYHSSRARVMEILNNLLRSLNFRMLRQRDIVDFTPGTLDDPDSVPLSLTLVELTKARNDIKTLFHQRVEEWSSEPERFPINFSDVQGHRYYLNVNDRTQLVTKHTVTLKISKESADEFEGLCNVRICRVRFGFTGLKVASGAVGAGDSVLVRLRLTHNGVETIFGRKSEPYYFQHKPVPAMYEFRLGNDNQPIPALDGNIGEADISQVSSSYAPVGPFAQWKVEFVGVDFTKLDLSGVTNAYFDFCGTCYATESD